MTYSVWLIRSTGVETIATGVDAERAESIARHPSLSAGTVTILPTWADAPTVDR